MANVSSIQHYRKAMKFIKSKNLNRKQSFVIGYTAESYENCETSKKISDSLLHAYDSNNIIFKDMRNDNWHHFGGPAIQDEKQINSRILYKTFDNTLWKTKTFARKEEDALKGYSIRAVSNVDRLTKNQTLRVMYQIHDKIGDTRHDGQLPAPILQSQQMNMRMFTCGRPNEKSGIGECYGKYPLSFFSASTILSLNLMWPNEKIMGVSDFARVRLEQHDSSNHVSEQETHGVTGFGYVVDGLHTIADFYSVNFEQKKRYDSENVLFYMDVLSDDGDRPRDILSARCEENCDFSTKSDVKISSLFRKFYTMYDTIQMNIIHPANFSLSVDDSVLSRIEPCLSQSTYQHSSLHLSSNNLQLDHMAYFESSNTNILKVVKNEVYGISAGTATVFAIGRNNNSQITLDQVEIVVEDSEEQIEYIDAILMTGVDDSFTIQQNLKDYSGFVYAVAIYKNGDKHELLSHEYDLLYDYNDLNVHGNKVILIKDQNTPCTTTRLRIRPHCSLKSFPISIVS